MGNMNAIGMAGAVSEGQVSLRAALEWNLRSNHFPPVSLDFVPTCEAAIEKANAGDWEDRIEMPNGMTKTVGEIVDGLHLHSFVQYEDDE
jgi:hypothetical protein